MELAAKMLANPRELAEAQMNLWWDYMSLWQSSMLRMHGRAAGAGRRAGQGRQALQRRRLAGALPVRLRQAVVPDHRALAARARSRASRACRSTTQKKVDFFTRQYIDALAPSNFALTNPEVFRETVATGGQNLVKGLNNLLDDIERGNGQLRDLDDRHARRSSSASTSRRRRARSSSRTS